MLRDYLVGAGWHAEQIVQITHENDAAAVRMYDGQVVHIETGSRPHLIGNFTSTGIEAHIGDFVLCAPDMPSQYLPRLVAMLAEVGVTPPDDREAFERWRPTNVAPVLLRRD